MQEMSEYAVKLYVCQVWVSLVWDGNSQHLWGCLTFLLDTETEHPEIGNINNS